MSFASLTDLSSYLGESLPAGDARGQLVLDLATAVVQARTGQKLTAATGATFTTNPDGGEDIWLPQRPVTAVTSVTTRDRNTTVTMLRVVNVDYEVRGPRVRWVGYGCWPYEVTITYNYGYATIPDDVRAATLAVAAEMHANPDGVSSETIDDYTWRSADEGSSTAESLLKVVERRYGHRPLTVRLA